MRFNPQARRQRAESLGDGPVAVSSIGQDADDQANDQHTGAPGVQGDGWPLGNHVFGHGNEH